MSNPFDQEDRDTAKMASTLDRVAEKLRRDGKLPDARQSSKRKNAAAMLWKPEHRIALIVCAIAGAAAGLLFGFVLGTRGYSSLGSWLNNHPGDALTWAVTGALTVGAAVYAWRSFSR